MNYPVSYSLRKDTEKYSIRNSILNPNNDNTYSHAGDSYPFYLSGISAIFFFANSIDPDQHTIKDLSADCNFEYCKEFYRINCALFSGKN